MIDSVFYWVGAVVCGLGAVASVGATVVALFWVITNAVLARMGLTHELILAAGQRRMEVEALRTGDISALADAHRMVDKRFAEYRKGREPSAERREVDP